MSRIDSEADLRSEEGLPGQKLGQVAVFGNPPRPVMGQENVQRPLQLLQAVHVQLSDVVGAPHCVVVKGRMLVVPLQRAEYLSWTQLLQNCRQWLNQSLHGRFRRESMLMWHECQCRSRYWRILMA